MHKQINERSPEHFLELHKMFKRARGWNFNFVLSASYTWLFIDGNPFKKMRL